MIIIPFTYISLTPLLLIILTRVALDNSNLRYLYVELRIKAIGIRCYLRLVDNNTIIHNQYVCYNANDTKVFNYFQVDSRDNCSKVFCFWLLFEEKKKKKKGDNCQDESVKK